MALYFDFLRADNVTMKPERLDAINAAAFAASERRELAVSVPVSDLIELIEMAESLISRRRSDASRGKARKKRAAFKFVAPVTKEDEAF